ncbi:MAG: DNA recombination protein RmuC [Desulfobacca sp.]|uniref:DNA recombination protein RmuC n=1 Tax=Desulfobacca sp. TaxID=2067990 RepID=UPI00404913AF
MSESIMKAGFLIVVIVLLMAILILLWLLWRRQTPQDLATSLALQGELLDRGLMRLEQLLREEIGRNREEFLASARRDREELAAALTTLTQNTQQQLLQLRETLDQAGRSLQAENHARLEQIRLEGAAAAREQRQELGESLQQFNTSVLQGMTGMGQLLKEQMESFARQLQQLTATTIDQQEKLRQVVEAKLRDIQVDNAKHLDQMRATVDEKLQGTLEQRLGASFQQVSARLEQVHKGLGEMHMLAAGVGDLKRVLTNIKSRGDWGEIRLEALLEHLLAPEQFARQVKLGEIGGEVVEFALRLPGRGDSDEVWLPIDAKFPLTVYENLVVAQEAAENEAVAQAKKQLAAAIRLNAKTISEKYVRPPKTTDFAIMFLPNEGLYAEVLRQPGLAEAMQREFRVVIAGPTTFAALLNSLQMGFRTLAIQRRSSEVWRLLGAVKTEFGKFGDILAGVKKKLDQASHTMDDAARRSRAIERRLREVEALPEGSAALEIGE